MKISKGNEINFFLIKEIYVAKRTLSAKGEKSWPLMVGKNKNSGKRALHIG
jgi:hypothetical protein